MLNRKDLCSLNRLVASGVGRNDEVNKPLPVASKKYITLWQLTMLCNLLSLLTLFSLRNNEKYSETGWFFQKGIVFII